MVDKYHIRSLLGVGAFSRVYLADNLEDSQQYAIKAINKDRMFTNARVRSSIEREVGVLKVIDHPNIVRLEATMETEHILCIVLEYIEGGELFDLVQKLHQDKQGPLDEELVKSIFLQLVSVVRWLHEHNIVHRDLKLENVLIRYDDDNQPILKVTDFGLARVVDPQGPQLQTRCGSEEYAAPEIVQSLGYDGRLTDTWALGVILYGLLVGYLPFRYQPSRGEKVSQLFYRIVKAQVKWPAEWTDDGSVGVSLEAREVVEKILVRKPEGRILLKDIECLAWFAGTESH
ncbi:kinase-like domain-containing protein [Phycomyces nitens]|nr:kinase-like domain-containing protein [Phycomyces nitens]